MKKLIVSVLLMGVALVQQAIAQDSIQTDRLSQLLSQYYNLKDALVAGNAPAAASKAEEFVNTAKTLDDKTVSKEKVALLLKDATPISKARDINVQRDRFTGLSNSMFALAKSVKLTSQPIYQAYCPMKKANWLSNGKAITNPYYGNAMLTCGNVVEIINQ